MSQTLQILRIRIIFFRVQYNVNNRLDKGEVTLKVAVPVKQLAGTGANEKTTPTTKVPGITKTTQSMKYTGLGDRNISYHTINCLHFLPYLLNICRKF